MDTERPPNLRMAGEAGSDAAEDGGLAPASNVNAGADLAPPLLAATNLPAKDKLTVARGRAGGAGSLSKAIVDGGLAASEGVARMLAARHHMPLVDLPLIGVEK